MGIPTFSCIFSGSIQSKAHVSHPIFRICIYKIQLTKFGKKIIVQMCKNQQKNNYLRIET